MAEGDRKHWDEKYAGADTPDAPGLPGRFQPFAARFATARDAIEIACGVGRFSVWLAEQGVHVTGYDISPVAVAQATTLAARAGVTERCTFGVADFDDGVPAGEPIDLVVCNMFRDARLDTALIERLRLGGTLAVAALSEVGAAPGRFRTKPGELVDAFSSLHVLGEQEADGVAWLVAQRPDLETLLETK